jgi:hypothetical protein
VNYAAGIVRRHLRVIGSRWLKLNPWQQALLALSEVLDHLLSCGSHRPWLSRSSVTLGPAAVNAGNRSMTPTKALTGVRRIA